MRLKFPWKARMVKPCGYCIRQDQWLPFFIAWVVNAVLIAAMLCSRL
jgi:hypothetical protein